VFLVLLICYTLVASFFSPVSRVVPPFFLLFAYVFFSLHSPVFFGERTKLILSDSLLLSVAH